MAAAPGTPADLPVIPSDIATLLVDEARRINSPAFIDDDPVQFPRRFCALQDIEIAGLLSATLAWGNRKMICRDCSRLLATMGHLPYRYVMEEGYEELDDSLNIHRTFFARNLKHFLRGLRLIYSRHGSIEALGRAAGVQSSPTPAWELAGAINLALAEANGGAADSRCLPLNLSTTALKRLNMWLRWMVRRDGIVDLGVWTLLDPSQLYIPLDTHVVATSLELGLLNRRQPDRRAAITLTTTLRTLNPSDPTLFDYALFGLGMNL